jgi:hypothetical protein
MESGSSLHAGYWLVHGVNRAPGMLSVRWRVITGFLESRPEPGHALSRSPDVMFKLEQQFEFCVQHSMHRNTTGRCRVTRREPR